MKICGKTSMLITVALGMAYSYLGIDNLIVVIGIFGVFFISLIDWTDRS